MRLLLLVAALLGGLMVAPAIAGDKEVASITALFAPGPVDTTLFSAEFLKAVPATKISAAVAPLKATIGPVLGVTAKGGQSYLVETATYELPVDISVDDSGKIAGLLLHPPVSKTGSIDDLFKQVSGVAPQSAYLVTKNGTTLYSSNPDLALAVGSAFKLGILKALKDDIDAGTRKWSDVVTLEPDDISFPSGVLQGWPIGSPFTLHTLAGMMISISDNTAADTLLKTVGRDRVEAALGIAPVITTRELFTLKATPDLKAKYQDGDLAAKRAVLEAIDKLPLPDITKVGTPHDDGVEYYLSPAKLCSLIDEVGDLDVTQINPGVASKADWTKVSFKGGSEIGVLSFTTEVTGKDGSVYCVSMIWNGPAALDETAAGTIYAGVLGKLAKGS